ncbi:unnamed protein product [Penicillium palitans]
MRNEFLVTVQLRAFLDSLRLNGERTPAGYFDDLDAAIDCYQVAVQKTPHDHPGYTTRLDSLCKLFNDRYEQIEEIVDLSAAIDCCQLAVQKTPHDHPDYTARIDSLWKLLNDRHKETEDVGDLNAAIDYCQLAIQQTPHSHPDHAVGLVGLAELLEYRHETKASAQDLFSGEIADLNESIQSSSQAVNSTAENSPYLTERLEELGLKLQRRYRASFELHDIRKGILLYKRTLNASTDHEDYLREQCLSYLSKDRETRYQLLRGIPDLHKGIFLARKVTTPTTMDTFLVEDLFNDLGKLKLLYGVTHTIDHLNEANEWLDKAAKSEAIREEIRCSDEFDA